RRLGILPLRAAIPGDIGPARVRHTPDTRRPSGVVQRQAAVHAEPVLPVGAERVQMSAELLTDAHCGFHGKLPARMDFVSGGLPPGFGPGWEAWLEQGLTTSRNALGADWADAYFAMPIWRFLLVPLSSDARHRPLAGAFMPSVDGAGRTYPLPVVAACTEPFDP